jgi:hypothetical protein
VTLPRNDGKKLLPVVGQHLVAGLGETGAMLLQARQHGLVAIIDHGAAKAGDVARAGVVSHLLRSGIFGTNKKGNDDQKPDHPLCVLNQSTTRLISRARETALQRILRSGEDRQKRSIAGQERTSNWTHRRFLLGMTGLVPAIHDDACGKGESETWMPATSAGMTTFLRRTI